MGAERSSEATRVTAAPPTKEAQSVDFGDLNGLYARGLVTRGYSAEVKDGKVVTNAPGSVVSEMDSSFKNRMASKAKPKDTKTEK